VITTSDDGQCHHPLLDPDRLPAMFPGGTTGHRFAARLTCGDIHAASKKSTAATCYTGCKLSFRLAGLPMTSASNCYIKFLKCKDSVMEKGRKATMCRG